MGIRDWLNDRVLDAIDALEERIMGEFEDIQAALDQQEMLMGKISADIQRLHDELPATGGLTAEQTATIKARLFGVIGLMSAADDATPEP